MLAENRGHDTNDQDRDGTTSLPSLPYVEVVLGPGGTSVLAHDRHRLAATQIHGLDIGRVVYTSEAAAPVEARVRMLEAQLARGLQTARRAAQARRLLVATAAAGLPFLVGALLGLAGIWMAAIPVVGDRVGEFVGSAGSTVGGLPLAIVVASLPSVWLIRRALRTPVSPAPRHFAADRIPITVEAPENLQRFHAEADEQIRDLASLLEGNPRAGGERARRIAVRFDRLARVAGRHRLPAVLALAADAAAQFRAVTRPARRLVPGLRAPRPSVAIADVLRPYRPNDGVPRGRPAVRTLGVAAGLALASAAFFAAGVFRLGQDEALLLRPNEAVVFPSSATVLALGRGFDGPARPSEGTVSVIDRSGLFWAWPRPITDRRRLPLDDRSARVTAALPTAGVQEDVEVTFGYDVSDVKSFVIGAGRMEHPDDVVADLLHDRLEAFLIVARRALAEQLNSSNDTEITQGLRALMGTVLRDFVSEANAAGPVGAAGITLRTRPDFHFVRS